MKRIAVLVALLLLTTLLVGAAPELSVGDPAPDFELPGTDGKTYKLKDFAGKSAVVLAWYPKANTSGCTLECKMLKESGEKLKGYQVAYFAASTDKPAANQQFAKSLDLNFPLLSDPGAPVARAYGVAGVMPIAARWTFIIGKDGKILAIDKDVKPATAGDDLIKQLEALGIPKRT